MKEIKHVECAPCATKSGAPELCQACIQNRDNIEELNTRVEILNDRFRIVRDIIHNWMKP